ncbi:hypothetical protein NLM33_43640 [Bradyrhizobium sp. CCGUVB1N3]|uniref:hypothetical protein n=1 Tax=Bradyrhizobium sp. CCGUVB1N3 TaxID=2949629 RepID=UPI0020B3ACCB|nr:hypothetical protein [Bradyrhizobium sp. CCGUVB1N3]MCP3477055.1 hypothetical protein [Bradyrhizobium sp. CCGUVB1N3]
MDWALGLLAVSDLVAGYDRLAFWVLAIAAASSVGTIALRLHGERQGQLQDGAWLSPKIVILLVLTLAAWSLGERAGVF